ncbi:MAG: hypothetical protein NXI22_14420 [bacterium]|nr:hypothetical protein [bacterium]
MKSFLGAFLPTTRREMICFEGGGVDFETRSEPRVCRTGGRDNDESEEMK